MMKKIIGGLSILNLLFLIPFFSCAQKSDDIILKAMNDELDRNMKGLRFEKSDPPFFISYGIKDHKNLSIIATLGALIHSSEDHERTSQVRVLAGSYDFNDESLDDDITSSYGADDISVPLDDDYYGIRRSLWNHTNKIYIQAATHFNRNKLTLSQQGKSLDEIPHRSFAKTQVNNLVLGNSEISYDKTNLEQYVKRLSLIFKEYDMLAKSGVVLTLNFGTNYFLNSEGTKIKTPFGNIILMCYATMKDTDGNRLIEAEAHYATGPQKLPAADDVEKELRAMVQKLISKSKAPLMNDDYSGPVLFMGDAIGELYQHTLFSEADGLVATNSINTGMGEEFGVGLSTESKIGKTVVSESMTVKALPKQKKWKDIDLLGSFEADNEGVIPPDELVVIEHGVLKTLLNDRTITKAGQAPNGHGEGPGVISIGFDKTSSPDSLKKMLIRQAKEEGLSYAYIVKSINSGEDAGGYNRSPSFDIYRVSVDNGDEEPVRSAIIGSIDMKVFKKFIAASTNTVVQQVGDYENPSKIISFITPDALLFKQIEITGSENSFNKEDTFVESPLKSLKVK